MVSYTLSLLNPSSHLIDIEIGADARGAPFLDLEFPAWSPGRYFIYDFARNVQELSARGAGKELVIEKIAKGTWRIYCEGVSHVRLRYRMFADTVSGTFSQLDDRHAAINGASTFAYFVGRETEPIELEIKAPDGWKAYSSMKSRRREGVTKLLAANFDVLIDSPLEIGRPVHRRFVLEDITYHIVMDFASIDSPERKPALKERIDRFTADTEKTVRAYTKAFGRPEFDEYYFLVNIDPYAQGGDGMEHLASTRLVIAGYITHDDTYDDLVGVMSHEFFHIWNVKRMRPAELGPFDYTRELHTTLLWFAEGFTQYYGHLTLRRAGVWDDRQFYKELVAEINTVDQAPGRYHRNLREASFDTWHALSIRNPLSSTSNFRNTYVNYYPKGAVAALLLDLEIRRMTRDQRSLDDVMRKLYASSYRDQEVGSYHLKGGGYTEEDVLDAVEDVAGRGARRFLKMLIETRDDLDYAKYLRHVGVNITRVPATTGKTKKQSGGPDGVPFVGIVVGDQKSRAASETVLVVNVIPRSPAERAGIGAGDVIVAIDRERVEGRRWESVLGEHRAGETVEFAWFRGPRLMMADVTIANLDRRPYRLENIKKASPGRLKAREKWLG